jgi:tRNA(Phe) wybutosine-synthesizing methylase Tyw3
MVGIDAPLIYHGNKQVSDDYVRILCEIANEKLSHNFRKINQLFNAFQKGSIFNEKITFYSINSKITIGLPEQLYSINGANYY